MREGEQVFKFHKPYSSIFTQKINNFLRGRVMKSKSLKICLVMAVLIVAAEQGFGLTQYNDGGTHNISSTINDDVWVDYQAPGMQTTFNLLGGGSISYPYQLRGYNGSKINISGGSVGYQLLANDSTQVTISGGLNIIMRRRGR
jgi:hypothetical protein